MQFYKKKETTNLNNEYIKMIEEISSEQINNVCFECGTNNPEYISINNGVFICQECVQQHLQFPREISTIIINDLYSLNNNEVKRLYLGGNKKLIEFINFDFPRLKQFSPDKLYQTKAVDYYRKRLDFYIKGGTKPLKPFFESAYQYISCSNSDNFNHKKEYILSPKANISEKILSATKLTPISEGNQSEDENNLSSYSDEKNKEETDLDQKKNGVVSQDSNIKNESTFIYSPQKPKTLNGNNSAFISCNSSLLNKSNQNGKNNNYKTNTYNKNTKNSNYSKDEKMNDDNNKANTNIIQDDIKFNSDKNIIDINSSDTSNLNINNEKKNIYNLNTNDDNFGDDNTIRIIDGCMNISKENDSSYFIKNNKSNNDSIQLNNKEKNDDDNYNNKNQNDSNFKKESDKSSRLINLSNLDIFSEQSNKQIKKISPRINKDNDNDKIKEKKINNLKVNTNKLAKIIKKINQYEDNNKEKIKDKKNINNKNKSNNYIIDDEIISNKAIKNRSEKTTVDTNTNSSTIKTNRNNKSYTNIDKTTKNSKNNEKKYKTYKDYESESCESEEEDDDINNNINK